MVQRHVYRNDPIEEALCELRFVPSTDWDLTLPGRFYERVKDEYDGKPRQQGAMEAGIETFPRSEGSAFQVKGRFARVQFPTKDEKKLVAIGPDVLSVHVLRPYPSWDDFRPRISRAYESYLGVVEPTSVRSISIRYINQVLLEGMPTNLCQFFTIAPQTPPNVPLEMSGFLSRIESTYKDEPVQLTTTLASVEAPENHSAFLLDIEVTRDWSDEPLPLEEAMYQVNELREREREAFEASITPTTREVFDAGQNQ